ncbi:ABC transporter substrate-binding protein [Patulibacter sp. NPDC049589]|uniref:ABC transporter substrate-binding protein n=1 Tax=Patulibacter sp. NPDC049589 TaxID=3154731 RepID=UPI00341D6AEC
MTTNSRTASRTPAPSARRGARLPPGHRTPPAALAMLAALCALLLALTACGSSDDDATTNAAAGGDSSPLKVGVLVVAQSSLLDDTVAAYRASLVKAVAPRKVEFDVQNAQGQETLIQNLARTFARSDDDQFAVIGTPAVIAMAKLEKRRPVIAIAMGDPVGAKLAASLDAPGGNVTGSIDFVDPAKLLDAIAKTSPAPKRIGTIDDPSNQNSKIWVAALKHAAGAHGMSVVEATVASSKDVNSAARSLVGRTDALLMGPDAVIYSSLPAVASVARGNRLPLYLVAGDATASGVLASLGPDYPTIGTRTGEVAAKVAAGADPGTVPFARPTALAPEVNAATAKALGVTLPAEITGASR